ncbi:hypothetical protein [Algoriphagus machipongonensis]|uniref:hypothetical protein n=1 Tax=Algoriphagus machipongonensis TaxID=388413 RepID=UPI0000F3AA36|nr:hypothetical protein [Algoriphagus machipongonensis]
MTGGAGFSMSGNHSMKDNRNLGKIRPKSSASSQYDYKKKMDLVDQKNLDQAIQFRIDRKYQSDQRRKWIFRMLCIGGIILTIIIYLTS